MFHHEAVQKNTITIITFCLNLVSCSPKRRIFHHTHYYWRCYFKGKKAKGRDKVLFQVLTTATQKANSLLTSKTPKPLSHFKSNIFIFLSFSEIVKSVSKNMVRENILTILKKYPHFLGKQRLNCRTFCNKVNDVSN